jgi:hypothetical protein
MHVGIHHRDTEAQRGTEGVMFFTTEQDYLFTAKCTVSVRYESTA